MTACQTVFMVACVWWEPINSDRAVICFRWSIRNDQQSTCRTPHNNRHIALHTTTDMSHSTDTQTYSMRHQSDICLWL